MTPNPSFRDVEKLSAYLDRELKPSEIMRLEARLQTDPELASILKDLRQARGVLRQLPPRCAPRNFTLTPKMVGQKPPMPRTYPIFRFATVLATALLFFTFATNFMAPRLTRTASTVPYGIGSGGGDGVAEPELAMESAAQDLAEPAQAPEPAEAPAEPATVEEFAEPEKEAEPKAEAEAPAYFGDAAEQDIPAPAPTEGAVTADDSARKEQPVPTMGATEKSGVQEAFSDELFAQEGSPDEAPQIQPEPPISIPVQILLAGIAFISAIIAFALRYSEIRKWRAKAR